MRRVAWGGLDQALSSLTNFLLTVFVARTVGVEEFGAFGIGFVTYLVFLGVSRSIATEPLTIRYSAASEDDWRRATMASTGTALLFGIVSGIGLVFVGVFFGGIIGATTAVVGIGLAPLLVQDAWRFAFFAAHKGRSAFANDLVWTIALVPAVLFIELSDQGSTEVWILAWAAAAGAGAVFGIWQTKLWPQPAMTRSWLREHRSLTPPLVLDSLTLTGTGYLTTLAISFVASLEAVAAIRGAKTLMNAVNVAGLGAQLFAVPEAVAIGRRSIAGLKRFCVLLGVALFLVALAWGVFLLFMPEAIGRALVGATWDDAQEVVLPIALMTGLQGARLGALVGLRALALVRKSLAARTASSLLNLVGGVLGARIGDAAGAAWGMAAGTLVGTVVWWRQFWTAVREQPGESTETGDAGPRQAVKEGAGEELGVPGEGGNQFTEG